MKSGLQFLLAARRCEIAELERLSRTSTLVSAIGAFTHAVQRERGTTNLFLASNGDARFAGMRNEQRSATDNLRTETLRTFEALDTEPGHLPNGARLFNRIAAVMHALEDLPGLRGEVDALRLTPGAATETYNRLVASLLAVVFEAADSAGDPELARLLVALFNFMQGKEFAGQERAHGAAVFAGGRIDASQTARWRHLVDLQQHAFQVFNDFAGPTLRAADVAGRSGRAEAQVERLRRIGWSLGDPGMDESLPALWYESATQRIDAMRHTEDLLAQALDSACALKIAQARAVLQDEATLLAAAGAPARLENAPTLGPQLERSVLELVQDQAQRLQTMAEELEAAREALNERKLVERAKGLLMAHRRIPEDEAYKLMRQMAMNQKRRLGDVAQSVLSMAEMLPGVDG